MWCLGSVPAGVINTLTKALWRRKGFLGSQVQVRGHHCWKSRQELEAASQINGPEQKEGLEQWFRGWKHWLIFQANRVGFPAYLWQLTTIWSSSPKKFSTLFWSPGGLYSCSTHTCKAKTQTHRLIKITTEKAKKESIHSCLLLLSPLPILV